MKIKKIVLGFLFISIAISLLAQTEDNTQDIISNQIDRFMKECSDRGLFNGVVLVSKDDRIVYKEALGYADILNRIPLNIESKFDIGSLTKSFTAMCIMLLEESGRLSYYNTLSDYFPDFPNYADKITLHHLLCHQSGIPDYHNELAMFEDDLSSNQIIERLKTEELNFEPGTRSLYSNSGYLLLARIIEKISGLSYGAFLKENVFSPLGMNNSIVYDSERVNIKQKAIGRHFTATKEDHITLTGPSGVYTTIDDLFKWHLELCQPSLITQKSLDRALTPSLMNTGKQSREGYGWHIKYMNNKKIIEHGGASPAGYISYFKHPVNCEYSLIVLTNFFHSENFGIVVNGLTSILNGSTPNEIKTPIIQKLNKYIIENGIADLERTFNNYNLDTAKYMPFRELDFIRLSAFYKNRNQYKTAKAILNLYKLEYPNSKIPLEEQIDLYKMVGNKSLEKRAQNELQKLNAKLLNQEKVEIRLVNPKTEDYEMSLVVRQGPGSMYEKQSLIQPGETYFVIGISMNGEWLKLKREGWVYNRKGRISNDQYNSLPFMRYVNN